MLDIELKWMIVLLVNFLVLVYVLNVILFRPLLALFNERDATVKSALESAKEMGRKKDAGLERMGRELKHARQAAKNAFETTKEEGMNMQRILLAEAESESSAMLQKAREELKAEAEKARIALKSDAEKFSEEIVRKLVAA